jgi:hypothetical protein
MRISIADHAGAFAEDKDAAAQIRTRSIEPALHVSKQVTLDFTGVRLTTQSFIHALISSPLRTFGESTLKLLEFKGCNKLVRGIVETVVQYSLESLEET